MPAPIVFFDIAGSDPAALARFYRRVFGWDIGADGRLSVPVGAGGAAGAALAGALRRDPADKVIYVGVDDVAAALDLIAAEGGRIAQKRFEVPGVVVLGLFEDPAGNRMGLVEMDGDKPRQP
jgi:predicted enzyme related to lactoylglutathione lyase